ncbi:hypothetical protein GCM10025768_26260 [Microbacterium pseudoresistens]|uniref:Uncharacterized protein n=1 Tax=Microbacterium pseudoresistens TaxID=640634 RepID=A0A7Y9JNI3_9MICO|nr:hypothetical protein [Microbacterium pseudoresistens]NYD53739.1 hypothetical protein [Microbacterium pseudoresistens]
MSIITTSARPDPASGAALTWKQAADDVFVATRDGEFAGFISIDRHEHVAHNRHSLRIGSYPTMAAARAALCGSSSRPRRTWRDRFPRRRAAGTR